MRTEKLVTSSVRRITEAERSLAVGRILSSRLFAGILSELIFASIVSSLLVMILLLPVILELKLLSAAYRAMYIFLILSIGGIFFLVVIGFGVRRILFLSRGRREHNVRIQSMLQRGQVESHRFKTKDVVAVNVDAEHGPTHVFKLDENHCVVLREISERDCLHSERGYPNDEIEIVRLPGADFVLTFVLHGQYLKPSKEFRNRLDQRKHDECVVLELPWRDVVTGSIGV